MMKKAIFPLLTTLFLSGAAHAQDVWTPVVTGGLDNASNSTVYDMHVFNGQIYAGFGADSGFVYRSSTGKPNSWSKVYSQYSHLSVEAITSTTQGGGYIYISSYNPYGYNSQILRSADGLSWSPYYNAGGERMPFLLPFNGTGTNDYIYAVRNLSGGSQVVRSLYNSNDPNNLLLSWDTVLDMGLLNPYSNITSFCEHNGRLYAGTDYSPTIWTSDTNGTLWLQNLVVGIGFGTSDITSFSALASYGGYLYIGTESPLNGAMILRTNDDITFDTIATFPSDYRVTSMSTIAGQLWATLETNQFYGSHRIVRSSDGLTFGTSNDDGFGQIGNAGIRGNLVEFNNNVYYGAEHYLSAAAAPAGLHNPIPSYGAQIWRSCLGTLPVIDLGADALICGGDSVTFDAGAGFVDYSWSTGETTQLLTASSEGEYSVIITDASGCDNMDTIALSFKTTPTISILTPESFPETLCKGDTLDIQVTAHTNEFTLYAPWSTTTNAPIDNTLGDSYDTLNVSGIAGDCACTSLYSVTIDSLYHEYTGDVIIGLYSPSGSFINLSNYEGSNSNQGYFGTEFRMDAPYTTSSSSAPFTGAFLPFDDFSNLYGDPNGAWVLKVGDVYASDNGSLKGWSIRFKTEDTIMTYSWTPATGLLAANTRNNKAFPTASTLYTVTATNVTGCSATATVDIVVPDLIVTALDDSICSGMSTILNASGGNVYYWSPDPTLSGIFGASVTANPVSNTTYYVADTMMGCPIADTITIYVGPAFSIAAPSPASICFGDSVTLSSTVTGGTAPYAYNWDDASNIYTTADITISPATSIAYTLTATDAYGCYANSGGGMVSVTPSTDIYGHVGLSGGANVDNGNVVLYKFQPFLVQFDTVQVVALDASGNYHFPSVNHGDYLVEVYADSTDFPAGVPTYFGNTYLWDDATVVTHDCYAADTLDITLIEELGTGGGIGYLEGTILEGPGFGRMLEGEPIPGIDVKLGRNPGGQLVASTQTDANGDYEFSSVALNLPGENYVVYVDIPGLGRDSSYTFVVDITNSQFLYLDYYVDSAQVYIVENAGVGISNPEMAEENKFSVFPNPFKGNSTVAYTLGADAKVSLELFSVLGNRISSFVNDEQAAGEYTYNLDAEGTQLEAGIYFVSLTVDGKTSTQRIVVMK